MMMPWPYDWVAGWKSEHDVTLSKAAEKDLVETFERLDALEHERLQGLRNKYGITD